MIVATDVRLKAVLRNCFSVVYITTYRRTIDSNSKGDWSSAWIILVAFHVYVLHARVGYFVWSINIGKYVCIVIYAIIDYYVKILYPPGLSEPSWSRRLKKRTTHNRDPHKQQQRPYVIFGIAWISYMISFRYIWISIRLKLHIAHYLLGQARKQQCRILYSLVKVIVCRRCSWASLTNMVLHQSQRGEEITCSVKCRMKLFIHSQTLNLWNLGMDKWFHSSLICM